MPRVRGEVLRVGLIVLLAALLLLLQYDLWVAGNGVRQMRQLDRVIATQRKTNRKMQKRNDTLEAEVKNLKSGRGAVAALARRELGMIGKGETFYQVVHPPGKRGDAPAGHPPPPSGPGNPAASNAGH